MILLFIPFFWKTLNIIIILHKYDWLYDLFLFFYCGA